MHRYFLAYRGDPSGGSADDQKAWGVWIKDNMSRMVTPGQPLGASVTIGPEGTAQGYPDATTGYTVFEAADLEEAIAIASACPYAKNAQMELAEERQMGPGKSGHRLL